VPSRPGAFTLVELLVVLAIIATLTAIVMSVLVLGRRQGQRTHCLSNLRQVGMAGVLYAQDADGLFPPYLNALPRQRGCAPTDGSANWGCNPASLYAVLLPYTGASGVWFCPADDANGQEQGPLNVNHRFSSYKFEWLRSPEILDLHARWVYQRSLGPPIPSYAQWDDSPPSENFIIADPPPGELHGRGVNKVYVDLHAKWSGAGAQ
jgi:prepilin-type N-terminal cleavage/methylation domain-containing protein